MTIADLPEYLETLTRRLENLEIELSVLKKPDLIEPSIDIKEAAVFLGMKRQTLYQKVCNRKLPFHKSGRLLRFYKSELDAWLKGNQ